jgi:hypothetical protein
MGTPNGARTHRIDMRDRDPDREPDRDLDRDPDREPDPDPDRDRRRAHPRARFAVTADAARDALSLASCFRREV